MSDEPAFTIQTDRYEGAIVIKPTDPWWSGDWRHWIVEHGQITALISLLEAQLPARRCMSCRYWDGDSKLTEEFGICELIPSLAYDNAPNAVLNPTAEMRIYSEGGCNGDYGNWSGVYVRGTFGCVQWEGKDA